MIGCVEKESILGKDISTCLPVSLNSSITSDIYLYGKSYLTPYRGYLSEVMLVLNSRMMSIAVMKVWYSVWYSFDTASNAGRASAPFYVVVVFSVQQVQWAISLFAHIFYEMDLCL